MDGELLRWFYHRLMHDPILRHKPNYIYGDGIILLVYVFAVIRNRSVLWAGDIKHWPAWCQAVLQLPSRSQLNKRLKSESVTRWMLTINAELRDRLPRGARKVVDGKPLAVGGFSHDPDARWGKTPGGGWAKGYKLHAVVDADAAAIDAWQVPPRDGGEATVLRRDLIGRCGDLLHGATLRGDPNYDSNPAYRAVAEAGGRLIATRRKPYTGLGHCRHHPDRQIGR